MKTLLFLAGLGIGIAAGIIAGFHISAPPLIAIIQEQVKQINGENDAFRAVLFDKEAGLSTEKARVRRGR